MNNIYSLPLSAKTKLPDCIIERRMVYVEWALHKFKMNRDDNALNWLIEQVGELALLHDEEKARQESLANELERNNKAAMACEFDLTELLQIAVNKIKNIGEKSHENN